MEATKIHLGYNERDLLFQKEFTEFKKRVALNWAELLILVSVSFIISFTFFYNYVWESLSITFVLSLVISYCMFLVFSHFRRPHLIISRFDKEDIYQKISQDLFSKEKQNI